MSKYYDWNKTLSYDADITMVISARGPGKTYGMRKIFIQDYLKRGWRFVDISRFKDEMKTVEKDYFRRVGKSFGKYMFKVQDDCAYIAKRSDKPEWELCGYFVALSAGGQSKKMTFDNVKRLCMDECVLDKTDSYHRYYSNEWAMVQNIIDSCTRERADSIIKPKLYLLGNSCDILNPYFIQAGIVGKPPYGYTWHMDKLFLLHYVRDDEYAREKKQTLAGKMAVAGGDLSMVENTFKNPADGLIEKKSERAEHLWTFILNNQRISIWGDMTNGIYYITSKEPKNNSDVYVLTSTEQPNYIVIKRTSNIFKVLSEAVRLRCVRYDDTSSFKIFYEILEFVGYRV